MKNKLIYIALLAVLLTGCKYTNRSFRDFTTGQNFDSTLFYVVAQRNTDLSTTIPDDCYLPDGTPVNQYVEGSDGDFTPSTSSTSMTAVIQSLFGWSGNSKVVELSGIYVSCKNTLESPREPIMLSGKVIMPADGKFKRYLIVSHYTIGSNAEAPSNCFPLEAIFAQMGYCVVMPDYLGYGITADKIHPYLMLHSTAFHVISMFNAVRKYMESQDIHPEHDDVFLLGYSQGGATTVGVQYVIEEYGDYLYKNFGIDTIKIRRNFAGGGAYDVKATYDRFVQTNEASYPVAVPLVLQGMIEGSPTLEIDMDSLLQPRIAENIDEWINSKRYSSALINKLIGTRKTDEILSPLGMNRSSKAVSELYKELSTNSIIDYDWTPSAPIYMLHSMDDETVPFEANALRAREKWGDNNIQYNFGHYGTHVKTCLRFLYTVKPILADED